MPKALKFVERARALPLREARAATRMMSTLRELGWHRSVRSHSSVSADGQALPWWTYSATRWLELVLKREHLVFEFGSGSSTVWLADRVAQVHSVEHDQAWEQKVRPRLPANASLSFVRTAVGDADALDDDPYLSPLLQEGRPFDLIVVDGLARNACVRKSFDHLAEGGMILLDDGDRLAYRPAHDALAAAGFGRIDFYGPRPGVGLMSTTCVFSRDFDTWARGLAAPAVSGH